MRIDKRLSWIAPLTFGVLLGLYWTLHGLFYTLYGTPDQKRDYPLEIVLGLPLMAFCIAIHVLIRRLTNDNALYIWIIELVLVGLAIYVFNRSQKVRTGRDEGFHGGLQYTVFRLRYVPP